MLPGWKLVELRLGALSFFRLKNGLFGEKKENHVPCSEALVPTEVEPPMRPWTWQGGRGSGGQANVHSERGASDGHSLPHPPVAALLGLPPTRFLTPPPPMSSLLCVGSSVILDARTQVTLSVKWNLPISPVSLIG